MLKQLPASYLVMHSLPWVYPARDDIDAPAREGEADFLILHRQYGLLILEVKGGEITLKGRTWYRHVKLGLKEIKDPVNQARRSLWALKNRLPMSAASASPTDRDLSRVAFPHCLFKDNPPTDLPAEAIITMDDLAIGRCSDCPRLSRGRRRQDRVVGPGFRGGPPGACPRISNL